MNFIHAQQDYDNPNSLASRFRRARMRHVVGLIEAVFAERGACRIVDLGGRPEYWNAIDRTLLDACKVTITTVNLENQAAANDPMFVQATGDACAFDAPDGAFDIAHSNSVIEHVGDWGQMERFAAETRRLARRYYVQTPYFWFPIEPHFSAPFIHWAPELVRAKRFMRRDHGFMPRTDDFALAMRAVQHARLLDRAMMRHLFPDARHEAEKVAGLTKSLMAIRGVRLSRRTLLAAAPGLALGACGQRPVQAAPAAISPWPSLSRVAHFPVGACFSTDEIADPDFVAIARSQFDQFTAEWEMKMERILAPSGELRFDAADALADFCRQNGARLHGTTLVWYSERPEAFERLVGQKVRFERALRDYILAVAGRYRGLARGWDALNEAVAEDGHGYRGGIWAEVLGDDYTRLAFEFAREADPDAVLFFNDYNLETNPVKLDSFQRLLERLLKAGAPVNGIGTQTHLNADLPPGVPSRAIRALARFGLPIHVSELDIMTRQSALSFQSPDERLAAQARVAAEVAEAFMALPPAQRYAFSVWGVRDKDSWLRRYPNAGDGTDRPLLFDDAGRPKPAFEAVRQALAHSA